jgi:hypothetical protein
MRQVQPAVQERVQESKIIAGNRVAAASADILTDRIWIAAAVLNPDDYVTVEEGAILSASIPAGNCRGIFENARADARIDTPHFSGKGNYFAEGMAE